MVRPVALILYGSTSPEFHLHATNGANYNLQNHESHSFVSTPHALLQCQTLVSKLLACLVPMEYSKYLKCSESKMKLITFLPKLPAVSQ